MTPLIAVTGPHKRLRYGWWGTALNLLLSGTRSVYLTAHRHSVRQPVHGVIIGGGDDIEPVHYGREGDAGATYDPRRDAFEMTVIERCLESRIPILGICRGAQLLNVVLGGTLLADIRPLRKLTPNYNTAFPVKWVDVEANSGLSGHMRCREIKINSLHSQAIDSLGDSLRVVARDRDGFVQAVEAEQGFMVGVQWHPEYLPYLRSQRRLFNAFVGAARGADPMHFGDRQSFSQNQ